jgi:hypothetical protein
MVKVSEPAVPVFVTPEVNVVIFNALIKEKNIA